MDAPSLDVAKLLKLGRTTHAEWLAADAPIETIAESMAAMANGAGGLILIGVEEGRICGVEDPEAVMDRALQAALLIEPKLVIALPDIIADGDKRAISIHIPAGLPHIYALGGRYLQRRGVLNTPLKPLDLRLLMLQRGEISFEAQIAHGATLNDIDWDKVGAYAKSLRGRTDANTEALLLQRGCLAREGETLRPTNAGILLFGKDPQRFVRGAEITAVRFAGAIMSDTFTRQDIIGTLPDQIRRAETFLIDHLRKEVKLLHTMERQEVYEYPLEAARELVVNAVAHRDYSIAGDGIRLYIFSNRMDVNSPGGLAGPVTVANIKDERFSRNPIIVQVLADMGFIEKLGYGVDRVIELMRQYRMRAPEFHERAGGFLVTLSKAPLEEAPKTRKSEPERPLPESGFNGVYQGIAVNPRQEAAIALLLHSDQSRVTNSDLQGLFPDVHSETIRRDLVDLVNKNILLKMGEKRGSYYVLNKALAATEATE